jgi:hypothetical protein
MAPRAKLRAVARKAIDDATVNRAANPCCRT